ncbi:hypothetical protein BH11BAC3_BH11BAC3_30170 [soil metagenome]
MKFNLFFIFSALAMLAATGFSCKQNMLSKEDGFYYFPEKNIYYDEGKTTYYYSLNGGKSWDSTKQAGNNDIAVLGAKVSLTRPEQHPWANNDSDLIAYHGVSLNVINARTNLLATEDSLSRIKPEIIPEPQQDPTVVQDDEENNPPKKGLRKFFDKIFGKKKPKSEE